MFSLFVRREFVTTWRAEAPAFVVSFAIAEFFYKFHSFSLECLAFLATWFVLGGVVALVLGRGRIGPRHLASSAIK